MKTYIKIASIFIISYFIFTSGCSQQQESKLMKEIIKDDNLVELTEKIREDKSFSKENIDYFIAGIERLGFVKDSIVGKSVGQIIESQRNLVRDGSISNLKITATRQEMNFKMQMRFTQKLKVEQDTLNLNGIEFFVKNLSNKDITAISGKIRIVNALNQIVRIIEINYPNILLKSGQEAQQREFWNYEENNKYDIAFRNTQNLIAYWLPESITFSDGQKMSIVTPQQQLQ